jgi:predicted RNA-binding Zn ribbon-like protein
VNQDEHAGNVPLIGGNLAVDFVNTVAGDRRQVPVDHLRSYADLVAWAVHAGAIGAASARALRRAAAGDPKGASRTLARALALREAIHDVVLAVAEGGRPPAGDVELISAEAAEAATHLRIRPDGRRFAFAWDERGALSEVLHPIARSAAQLLTEGRLDRVRVCAGDHCGWLFVDTSKGGRRRWCDMAGCGSRAKARTYYRRRTTGGPA